MAYVVALTYAANNTALHRAFNNLTGSKTIQEDILTHWELNLDMEFHPSKFPVIHLTRSRHPIPTKNHLHRHILNEKGRDLTQSYDKSPVQGCTRAKHKTYSPRDDQLVILSSSKVFNYFRTLWDEIRCVWPSLVCKLNHRRRPDDRFP